MGRTRRRLVLQQVATLERKEDVQPPACKQAGLLPGLPQAEFVQGGRLAAAGFLHFQDAG